MIILDYMKSIKRIINRALNGRHDQTESSNIMSKGIEEAKPYYQSSMNS